MQTLEPYYLYSYGTVSYSTVLVQCIRCPTLKAPFQNLMCLTYLSTFTVGGLFPCTACIFGPWFYNDHINWRCTVVRPWAPKYGKSEQLGVSILRTIGWGSNFVPSPQIRIMEMAHLLMTCDINFLEIGLNCSHHQVWIPIPVWVTDTVVHSVVIEYQEETITLSNHKASRFLSLYP